MYNPFTLQDKTILVTGASSGIGKATAIECAKMGATVVITGRNEERLKDTYIQLEGKGHLMFVVDLIVENELNVLVEKLPVLNGIANVAGIVKTLPFPFVNKMELSNIFELNFFSPVILSQKIIKAKKIAKEASIVFVSSIDGPLIVHAGNSMYAASKAAISAIAKNMAIDLAPKKIRVNSILPGMTDTAMIHQENFSSEQKDADMKLYPLKRYGKPEEIAFGIIYLLSDASSWVTGTNLVIDGGFTLL